MSNYVCHTSHSTKRGTFYAGDIYDSAHVAVTDNPSFFEPQTDVTKRVAAVSFAYLDRIINRGDVLPAADAALTADASAFTTQGSAAEFAARLERIGGHR